MMISPAAAFHYFLPADANTDCRCSSRRYAAEFFFFFSRLMPMFRLMLPRHAMPPARRHAAFAATATLLAARLPLSPR